MRPRPRAAESLARVASLLALTWLALTGLAIAQGQPDPKTAADPVMRQLEAFRREDYDTAYGFASSSIRELFDRQAFEQMVKGGYPEIAQSASAHVTESRVEDDGHVYLRIKISGKNGKNIEALYDMIWEDGRFRINGVVAKPDLGLV